MKNTPLINGIAYSYVDIIVKIAGVPAPSVMKINYTEDQEKTNNFGTGERPTSRGKGKIEAKASLELSMNDIEAIRDVAPNGSLLALPPFDIEVHYLNAQKIVTHVIKNCEFKNDGNDASEGDTDIKFTYDLIPSHILYR